MTPIADMIEEMTARGIPADVILLAVRTVELAASNGKSGGSPVDAAAEKRRAYDRERKAAEREIHRKSGGSPVEVPNSSSSLPPSTQEDIQGKEGRKKRKSGHVLPDDWTPKDAHYAFAAERGRQRSDVDEKAEEVRLWARSNEHRAVAHKTNWDTMFMGCLRRDWKNGVSNVQATQRHPGGAYGASKDRFREAFDELKAFNAEQRGEGDGTVVELLRPAGRERA